MADFTVEPDRRCQRGLTYRYAIPSLSDPKPLLALLESARPGAWVAGEERWGRRVVHRRILQFRFEVRAGARPHEVTLHHRASAPNHVRASDRAWFEDLLRRLEPV